MDGMMREEDREGLRRTTYATARYWSRPVAAMNCSTAASCSPRVAYMRPMFVRILEESAMLCSAKRG